MNDINNSSLVEKNIYSAKCGRCGKILAEQKGHLWRCGTQSAEEEAEKAGWRKIDTHFYCPDCCHYDKKRDRYIVNGRENDPMRGDVVYVMSHNEIMQGTITGRNDDETLGVHLKSGYYRYKEKDIFRTPEALAQYLVFSYRQNNKFIL